MGNWILLTLKPLEPRLLAACMTLAAVLASSACSPAAASDPAAGSTTHPLSALPPGLSDEEWQRQAAAIAADLQSAPDAELTRLDAPAGELAYQVLLRRQPASPVLRLALAVPPQGVLSARLLESEPDSAVEGSRGGRSAADVTSSAVKVSSDLLGWVRNSRIEKLSIPLQQMGKETRTTGGVLRLTLKPAVETRESSVPAGWALAESQGPLRNMVRRLVANPGDVDSFAASSPDQLPGAAAELPWTPVSASGAGLKGTVIRVPVSESGLYRIRGSDLTSAAASLAGADPASLHLFLDGQEQPLLYLPAPAAGGASRRGIAPADEFVFRGLAADSRFSAVNTYWLVADGASAPRALMDAPAPPPGAPTEKAQAFPAKATVEEDHPPVLTRNDQFLTILDYRWVWWTWTGKPNPGLPGARRLDEPGTLQFRLPGLSPDAETVSAKAYFYVHSWPVDGDPVKVLVRVNGGEPIPLTLASRADEVKGFSIPASDVRAGTNTLTLELDSATTTSGTATADAGTARTPQLELGFDRLEIDYLRTYAVPEEGLTFSSPAIVSGPASLGGRRQIEYQLTGLDPARRPLVFDVTETAPLRVIGDPAAGPAASFRFRAAEATTRTYLLRYTQDLPFAMLEPVGDEPDLRASSNRADYIILSHADFLDTMKPFAEAKRAAGHDVALVDVRHVYDQFSAGLETPEAIRAFLRHAATSWQSGRHGPAASAVLLVGDCTSAYRGQFRNGVKNYVPTYSVSGWSESDRYASDLWFAQISGEDLLADLLIGRFSVNNTADLQAILKKQAVYAAGSEPGPWRNTLAFIADHTEFEAAVDRVMSASVPDAFFRKRIRMADEPWADNYYFPKEVADAKKAKVSPSTTAKIRDMFNEGAAVVTYFGHGSPNVWSTERIWFGGDSENSDNLMLRNGARLPLIINMTCNSGAIDYPMPKWNICISEDFMRVPDAGAIACYVPSGPGITAQHEKLTLELNRALLAERVEPLGSALALSSWRYLLSDNPPDLVRMFVLLGDPMLKLDLPASYAAGEGAGPLTSWLAGSPAGEPCRSVPPPPISGAFAQIVHQEPDSFAATQVMPLASAPLAVQRDCQESTGNCGPVDCSSLAPRLRLNAPAGPALGSSPVAALLVPAGTDGPVYQYSAPVGAALPLILRSWSPGQTGVIRAGERVQIRLAVENAGTEPVRSVRIGLSRGAAEESEAVSQALDLLPGEERSFAVEVVPRFGLNHYRVSARTGSAGTEAPLNVPHPVVLAAAPGEGDETEKPAVLIDPESVLLRWSRVGASPQATLRFQVHNVATYGAGDLTAGLMTSEGTVLPDTITTVTSVAPGTPAQVEVRRIYATGMPPVREPLTLRLDPRATRPDYASAPAIPVTLGSEAMPDLVIPADGVRVSETTPSDGETVFFDVDVVNQGRSTAENVRVTAFLGETSKAQPLETRIPTQERTVHLDPGASHTLRVRWDPFANAGQHRILLRAAAEHGPDLNPSNNERVVPLRVLSKYDLRKGPITILPLSPEDKLQRQIRILARIYNRGESPAHGVRMIFYPGQQRNPAEAIGDLILDEVPGKGHRDAVLTYKLKPGEETRVFHPSFDAFLKGSLQRAPQAEDATGAASSGSGASRGSSAP